MHRVHSTLDTYTAWGGVVGMIYFFRTIYRYSNETGRKIHWKRVLWWD